MTDPKEIERVQEIHKALDYWSAKSTKGGLTIRLAGEPDALVYSSGEVARWPETKALLLAELQKLPELKVATWDGSMVWRCYSTNPWQDRRHAIDPDCIDAYQRGLCLYREMLPTIDNGIVCTCDAHFASYGEVDRRCPEHGRRCANPDCDELCAGINELTHRTLNGDERHFCSHDCWASMSPDVRGIDPAADAPESFKAKAHRFNDEQIAALMMAQPGNVAARQRNVAALAREHVKQSDVSGLLHPLSHWSGRNPGRRAR